MDNMYTVYDIETSGLEKDSDIYEFAYIRLDRDFNVIKNGVLYFYKKNWMISASNIHGLAKEDLEEHAKEFYKNLAVMYATINGSIAIGKNNMTFDNPQVINFLRRHTYDVGKDKSIREPRIKASIDVQNYMAPFYRKHMDSIGQPVGPRKMGTLEDYMNVCGFTHEMLIQFAEGNGIEVNKRFKAHGAMYDTVMTLATLKWLMYSARVPMTPR